MFTNVHNILDNDNPQVCRLCLVKEENLIYIFDPEGYQGFRLWEVIKELLQVEVSKEDGMPWTICNGCLDKVKDFKRFKTTCIHAKISFLTMIANRGFVSSLEHGLPSPPSREAIKIIQKRPSIEVNRKDSNEVEVVEIVEEESPDTSADEDPLAEVTVRPKDRESGYGGKLSLAHGRPSPTSGEAIKIIRKRPSSQVNTKDSDEVEVVELVKEESPDTSTDEDLLVEVTVRPKERESGHGGKSFLAPWPPSQPSLEPTETILKRSRSETRRKVYDEVEVVEIVKEETPVVLADEDPPWEITVSRRERDKDHGERVDGCGRTEGSPKMVEDKVTDLGDDSEKNITEKFERNPSPSGLHGEHSLINVKKYSKKKGKMLKSSDYIKSTFKFSGMMPSEQRQLDFHSKKFAGCTEFTCDYCGSTCTDKIKLAAHVRYHILTKRPSKSVMPEGLSQLCLESRTTGIQISKPFICEMCGKIFKSKTELKRHIVVHSNLKPFICESCGKGFKRKNNLVGHSIVHSGLRPFKCDTCGRGFTHKSNLVRHSVVHTALRRYKCKTCGKDFKLSSGLRRHLKIHS